MGNGIAANLVAELRRPGSVVQNPSRSVALRELLASIPVVRDLPANALPSFDAKMLALPFHLSRRNATYTRASVKNVVQDGALVQLASNQFGTSYDSVTGKYGYVPEPAATNLLHNSGLTGGGSVPTNYGQFTGTGTSTPVSSTLGGGATAYLQTATAQRPGFTFAYTFTANTTYTLSMYIESISGTITASSLGTLAGAQAGDTVSYPPCPANPSGGDVAITNTGLFVCRLSIGGSIVAQAPRFGLGCSTNATGSVQFSRPQLETGLRATSWILSPVGSTATRAADVLSVPVANIPGFNSAAYTLFADGRVDAQSISTSGSLVSLESSGSQRSIIFRNGSTPTDYTVSPSTQSNLVGDPAGVSRFRFSVAHKSGTHISSQGGSTKTSDVGAVMPTVSTMYIGTSVAIAGIEFNGYIFRAGIIPQALSQAQINGLTA